jgi:AcrR family transcriptional regulator
MSEWERARTSEQKESREKEILQAAKKLLDEKSYESIRFSDLAELVTFSRANIYKYFESKEEVYLSLLADEILKFAIHSEKILNQKANSHKITIDDFCNTWGDLFSSEKNLLLLLSMTGTILEKNCSDEILLQSKTSMNIAIQNHLIPSFSLYFPTLSSLKISELINNLVVFANGLYSLCGLNEHQKNLLKANGMEDLISEFSSSYKRITKIYLQGFLGQSEEI